MASRHLDKDSPEAWRELSWPWAIKRPLLSTYFLLASFWPPAARLVARLAGQLAFLFEQLESAGSLSLSLSLSLSRVRSLRAACAILRAAKAISERVQGQD